MGLGCLTNTQAAVGSHSISNHRSPKYSVKSILHVQTPPPAAAAGRVTTPSPPAGAGGQPPRQPCVHPWVKHLVGTLLALLRHPDHSPALFATRLLPTHVFHTSPALFLHSQHCLSARNSCFTRCLCWGKALGGMTLEGDYFFKPLPF